MKTFKIIVYSVLIAFHLTTIIVLTIGKDNFDFLLSLFDNFDLLLYGAYIGLLFFLTVIFFEYLHVRAERSLNKKHEEEINQLKAKLYDKKENEQIAPKPEESQKGSESPSKEEGSDEQKAD